MDVVLDLLDLTFWLVSPIRKHPLDSIVDSFVGRKLQIDSLVSWETILEENVLHRL